MIKQLRSPVENLCSSMDSRCSLAHRIIESKILNQEIDKLLRYYEKNIDPSVRPLFGNNTILAHCCWHLFIELGKQNAEV